MSADSSVSESSGGGGQVKELAGKYREEFEQTYDVLKRRGLELSDVLQQQYSKLNENMQTLQPQIKQQGDEVLQTLQNVEPLPEVPSKRLTNVFAWVSVMQFGYFVAAILGGYFLYPFVGLFLGTFWSALLVYALLPGLALSQLLKGEKEADTQVRFKLLGLALVQGLLTGYLFSSRYLSAIQPLAFCTPLFVAVSALHVVPFLGANPQRTHLLGAYLGTGLLVHLGVGIVLGQLSLSYLVLALLYTGVAFCTLQLYFKYHAVGGEEASEGIDQLHMLAYFVASIYAQSLVFVVFGGAKSQPLSDPVIDVRASNNK